MTRRRGLAVLGCVAILILIFLAIQLVPVWLLQTDPPVIAEPKWDSPQTRALAERACFDCHSNQTQWPWYSRVAPLSWYVTFDVIRGRRALNFSEWGVPRSGGEGGEGGRGAEGVGRIDRVIQRGDMPPSQYIILHPEGNLSPTEKQQLIQGLNASLGTSP